MHLFKGSEMVVILLLQKGINKQLKYLKWS